MELVDLFWTRRLFPQDTCFFPRSIKIGLFYQELRCFGARNKFRTVAIPRIFSVSTKHLDLPDCCKYLPGSSLRIKKNAIIFPGSKQIPQKNTSVSQIKQVNLYQNSKFYKRDVSLFS